jgi:putative transposon-encoded protein
MRKIELRNHDLNFHEQVLGFLEKEVTSLGNSGKVDCPKRFIGKRAYLIVCEEEFKKEMHKIKQHKRHSAS